MLLYHLREVCIGALVLLLIILACTGYAYRVNSQRPDDDPEKKDYQPGTVIVTLFTWPFLLAAFISLFLLRALFYSLFLVLFIFVLIFIPERSAEPTWLEKTAAKIGDKLLQANNLLIKLLLRPWAKEPEAI